MQKMTSRFLVFLAIFIGIQACSPYQKILKTGSNELKYETAMDFYEKKDYNKALELFELLRAIYRGTDKGKNVTYYTAYSYYHLKDYIIASYYFKEFYRNYPGAKHAEECTFMSAYCQYKESPKYSLDQSNTLLAISELQSFIDTYPNSERMQECNELIDELRAKLEHKDFNLAYLYYKMRYYQSAIASFENLLDEYPDTDRREEVLYYIVKSYYEYAENSVDSKKRERYELALESYNNLIYLYPESELAKDVDYVDKQSRAFLGLNN